MSEVAVELPQHSHDCQCCTFLGRLASFDLYHCLQGGRLPTVIARFGSDGPDYFSGIGMARFVPALGVAKRRARDRGLTVEA